MTKLQTRKTEAGFTLVELAIVLIIVGLLIGGILKGQELIGNARVTSQVSQLKGIDGAVSNFRDQYQSLPGDIVQPGTRLPNCGVAPCSTAGNGNNRVQNGLTIPGSAVTNATEPHTFFTHLAAADMLGGVNVTSTAPVNFGDEIPQGTITGSGITMSYSPGGAGTLTAQVGAAVPSAGHYLVLTADANNPVAAANAPLTPVQAANLDRKMDDGSPVSGSAIPGGAAGCIAVVGGATVYNESVKTASCALYVRIQG